MPHLNVTDLIFSTYHLWHNMHVAAENEQYT